MRVAHVLRSTALTALAYVGLGGISLLLAVAPGYASPLFPSAGLALAAMLHLGRPALVAVWFGSALLNLINALLSGKPDSLSLSIAALIGTGAAMQAGAGAWLISRVMGERWRELESERDVVRFLLLGGVISTLISSSLCVTGLYGLGVINHSDYLFAWWNWYVGDSVGVIVFAPLFLCFFNRHEGPWRDRRRRIIGPTLLTGGLVALAFYGVAQWERQAQQNQLQADGQAIAKRIADRVVAHREVLASLRNFIEATPAFTFRQFEQFTRITLEGHQDIHALSFNDFVPHEHRVAYEKAVAGLSMNNAFQITERNEAGTLRRAGDRPDYVAVRYIVPLATNRPALGFDIYSEPTRREAINRALASGGMVVTKPLKLVQEQQRRTGVLELLPVRNMENPLAIGGVARPSGFAVAVIKADEMVAIATRDHIPDGIALQLTDAGMPAGQGLLFSSGPLADGEVLPERASHWSAMLPVGDRQWLLSVYPGRGYFQHNRPLMVWAMGVVGLTFAFLMQVLILGMIGRSALIHRKNAALRASEDRYQRLFNDSPLPMWQIAAGSRRFLMVNDKAVEHYGWSREAFLAMTLDDILVDGDAVSCREPQAGHGAGDELPRCRHRRRDGSEIEVIVSASMVSWGDEDAYVQVIQDITQQIQLIAARETAEQSSMTKSRFLATVSHELRTPMNGILGMAQLLQRPGVGEAERLEYAQVIMSSGHVLLGLLNDILDFSKVEAGKLTLNPARLEVAGVLQEVMTLFAEPARRKGLAFSVDWQGPESAAYMVDRQRLVQMLANLVGNAVKFTDAGSVRVEAFQVEADGEEATLEFAVTDTGIGVPEDKQHLMFHPFSQADSSATRQHGGTWLGLSIVSSLAELMGGSVGLSSRAGEGARFWFRIRAEVGDAPAAPVVQHAPVQRAPVSMGGQVLLVEDNATNRRVVRSQLASRGVGVVTAANGQECLDLLAQGASPDLVLMDVQMPVMDGLATTAEIRRREAGTGRRLPIVALTADAFAESRAACMAAGMDDFVTKPVMLEALVGVLQRWLPPAPVESGPAEPDETLRTLDGDRLGVVVDELDHLLQSSDFDAIGRFRELKTLVAGTVMESDFDEVGRLVGELRFSAARECLRQVFARTSGVTE